MELNTLTRIILNLHLEQYTKEKRMKKMKTLEQLGNWYDKVTNNEFFKYEGIQYAKDQRIQGQILATGFISGDWSGTGSAKRYPMPENYLSESNLPKELLKQVFDNGWTDKNGNVYFEKDFQPEPVKGNDGNVHMLINDQTPKELVVMKHSMKAMELLYNEDMTGVTEALQDVSKDLKKSKGRVKNK